MQLTGAVFKQQLQKQALLKVQLLNKAWAAAVRASKQHLRQQALVKAQMLNYAACQAIDKMPQLLNLQLLVLLITPVQTWLLGRTPLLHNSLCCTLPVCGSQKYRLRNHCNSC